MAYRGYFNEKRARKFAAQLKSRGYDVVVEGVPAYSTLGKLPDPVMSTMMRYGTDELAAMIFHELAHQLLYVKDDSRFDEAFAVTVENEGLRRWLEYHDQPARIAQYEQQRAEDRQFVVLLRRTSERLARLYASDSPRKSKLQRKAEIFAGLAEAIRALERRLAVHSPIYDAWIAHGLNNADLASVRTYYDCVPGFERLLRQENGDLPRFYQAARKLAQEPRSAQRRPALLPSHSDCRRSCSAKPSSASSRFRVNAITLKASPISPGNSSRRASPASLTCSMGSVDSATSRSTPVARRNPACVQKPATSSPQASAASATRVKSTQAVMSCTPMLT